MIIRFELLVRAAACAVLAGFASAHGVLWISPEDAVPTDPVSPGSQPGPGDQVPNGPYPGWTPGGAFDPANPNRPGVQPGVIPGANAPGTGGTGAGPGSTIASGTGDSGVGLLAGVDLTEWEFWWQFNKEPFLDLRRVIRKSSVVTGSDGFFLGFGYRGPDVRQAGIGPSDATVEDVVVPALLQALEQGSSTDLVAACLIALARIGDDLDDARRAQLEETIRPYLADSNQEIRETAAVALGILGSRGSTVLLAELLSNTAEGRAAVGGKKVSDRTRAFAAYGLGLAGNQSPSEDVRRFIVHKLLEALASDRSGTPDIGVACVLSLGLVPLRNVPDPVTQSSSRRKKAPVAVVNRSSQAGALLDVLDDRMTNRIVRSHVPTALGWLMSVDVDEIDPGLREEVAEELMDRARSRHESRYLLQSAVTALGLIGDNDQDEVDVRIERTLMKMHELSSDRQTRHLALLAMGRVAGREGAGEPRGERDVRKFLLSRIGRGRAESRWAALGAALLERERIRSGRSASSETLEALIFALEDTRAPADIGAYSIACGLVRNPDAEGPLLEKLDQVSEDRPRGYVLVALGLIDARTALEPIRQDFERAVYRPELLREAAIALALIGDRDAVSMLIDKLEDAGSLVAQASIAQALGKIGDASSVEPLLEHMQDAGKTAASRSFAAAALGIVADRDDLPWNTVLATDVNYNAAPPTLFDYYGFGVLNLL